MIHSGLDSHCNPQHSPTLIAPKKAPTNAQGPESAGGADRRTSCRPQRDWRATHSRPAYPLTTSVYLPVEPDDYREWQGPRAAAAPHHVRRCHRRRRPPCGHPRTRDFPMGT
ncbi:Hypothetical predicted protein [Pelobates cultripes]|uniref:Uncharacterized protein n=1 Tax=Pelobates cultripes TaxID=61616 RepID=A0AAD1T7W7_PELCU|nr:Hypothetical predicted protein [Pelobates cultripes]